MEKSVYRELVFFNGINGFVVKERTLLQRTKTLKVLTKSLGKIAVYVLEIFQKC